MTTYAIGSSSVEIDPAQALQAVGGLSVALGGLAVLAPARTAGLLGVKGVAAGSGPLLVRMVGVRNLTMGLRTLQAGDDERQAAVQAGFVVGAVDATAVLLAARRGAISKKAAFFLLLLLGAIAAGGAAALADD